MNRMTLENLVRNEVLEQIVSAMTTIRGTDVLQVSPNSLMMPVVDPEGNERYAVIEVSIPRGTRAGGTYIPYDGYAAAEEYRLDQEQKEAEAKAKQAAREAREKEQKKKQAEREENARNRRALLELRKARLEELAAIKKKAEEGA